MAKSPVTGAHAQPKPETTILSGNEALARGAYEAGVRVAASYPGTPSTEILEWLAGCDPKQVYVEWAANEKVAFDVAAGASFAGARALVSMKHVGLNVAADSLMSMAYTGVNGGFVLICCDDPGIYSSQNEQDSRYYARCAGIPVLEPSDVQEAKDYVIEAFEISEHFDTPVMVRSTTRVSHCNGVLTLGQRKEPPLRGFQRNPGKYVMIPLYARARHAQVLERLERLAEFVETTPLNRWEQGTTKVGVITSGASYQYVREVLPEASVLVLGVTYPLPLGKIRAFADSVERLFVVEELEPLMESEIRAAGIEVSGKALFPRLGEFSPDIVANGFARAGLCEPPTPAPELVVESVARPPVLCPGCPHFTPFMALRALDAIVAGDIGCYTLSVLPPLQAMDTCLCMGASIGNAIGMEKAGEVSKPVVAAIGDSTFLHAGIPALMDAVYNKAKITVVILDNSSVAMTGGQDHPGTGRTARGEETHKVDLEALCRALGVQHVRTVDSYDVGAMFRGLREAIAYPGVSVVISNRPCVLDPVKIKGTPYEVVSGECIACQACMNLGCPSITWTDELYDGHHKVRIDPLTCVGCTVCAQVCPTNCVKLVSGKAPGENLAGAKA